MSGGGGGGAMDDFCLRWNDHHDLFFNAAEQLCRGDFLTDVTLSCGDRYFSAHKLVLSISSGYFAKLFASRRAPPFTQTIVYLKDVDPKHLELILSYMYRGEINVRESELMELLATAKGLQVKGLTDTGEADDAAPQMPQIRPPPRTADGSKRRLVVHSRESAVEGAAKRIKTEERWHGAQQDAPGPSGGAAVIQRADPDYQGQGGGGQEEAGYDEDYYAAPGAGEAEGDEDYGTGQDIGSMLPLETSLLEEEDDEDSAHSHSGNRIGGGGGGVIGDMKPPLSPPTPPPPPSQQQSQQQQSQQQPLYHCPFCAKPFHARWMLERHLPSHTGQRPYKCVRCERRFSLQSSAVRHVKNVHRGEENFDAESEAASMVIKEKAIQGVPQQQCGQGGGGGGLFAGGNLGGADGDSLVDAGDNQIVIG